MKAKFYLSAVLIAAHSLLTSSSGGSTPSWQQENVSFPMMNLEIRHTMEENGRQKEMKNKQALNLATENQNKKQWTKLRETTVKIQDRLRFVDFAMQSIFRGFCRANIGFLLRVAFEYRRFRKFQFQRFSYFSLLL